MPAVVIRSGQFNIGHICSRFQCNLGLGEKTALRWLGAHDERADYTFNDLERQSSRFANVLQQSGFSSGEVFFIFLPRMPEVYFAFLGALKARLITGTLFSNFGDKAFLDRLGDAGAHVILTRQSYLELLPGPGATRRSDAFWWMPTSTNPPTFSGYARLMESASDHYETPITPPETPSALHYTSGSTGKPKSALHCHRSVLQQSRTAAEILSLKPDDLYWCTADHGWVTGTSYGIIGPWSLGITQVHFGGAYDAAKWFQIWSNIGSRSGIRPPQPCEC